MDDKYNLTRFVRAQDPVYARVVAELEAGRKASHWMWFVFPQLAGLGHSPTARLYAIASLDEARAYLAHPVLGARLRECAGLLLALPGSSAPAVFGGVDAMKLRSSMTLFWQAGAEPVFAEVLAKYYDGEPDAETLRLLG
jgi:uncharacterized protein (DUF1810 family)